MCGITGYFNSSGINETDIEKMNYALRHRGPDDSGIFVDSNQIIGFGHQRLSIIDLEGGKQPMSNETNSVWITFNGEIYNFQEIRKKLIDKYNFKTNSDTEVILHLYEEVGKDCVKYLRGMFSFAIYDFPKKRLLVARDHLGQKPLYYWHEKNSFAFASEIKALLALKPELRELDLNALYEYLTTRIITPPRSMFSRILKLPPGHYLLFEDGRVEIERYWQLRYEPKMEGTFESLLEELDRQIESSVRYHLVSDVPVGAFLSGGVDSSLIVSMMTRVANEPINTFTGDVPYENFSEIPYARLASERYQTEHHELPINPSLMKSLPDLIWHLDEPSDPLSVCMYHLAKLTRKHVKVVLGGDGGDELFGGYDRYYGNVLVDYYALVPDVIRDKVFGRFINSMPEGFWYRSFSHRLRWMHQMASYKSGNRYAKSLSYFYFRFISKLPISFNFHSSIFEQ